MTTPIIQWSVTPQLIQYQSRPVRLDVAGLAPHASYRLTVETPTDPAYLWEFYSDAAGVVSEDLYLSSGVGRYNFIQEGCPTWPAMAVSVVVAATTPGASSSACTLAVHVNRRSVPHNIGQNSSDSKA